MCCFVSALVGVLGAAVVRRSFFIAPIHGRPTRLAGWHLAGGGQGDRMPESNEPVYFYMAGAERRGPFPFDLLIQQPVHRLTPVWCRGMKDWQPAQDVPAIADRVPPPPPSYMHGPMRGERATAIETAPDLTRYADALRRLNVGMLFLIAGTLLLGMLSGNAFRVVYVIAVVAWGVVLYQAARALSARHPWLWAVGSVAPLVGYVPLIMLHSRLKRPLEAAGYRISFFGRATPPAGLAI